MTTHYDPYPRQAAAPAARSYSPPRARSTYMASAGQHEAPAPSGLRLDGLAVAALIIVVFLIFQSLRDRAGGQPSTPATNDTSPAEELGEPLAEEVLPSTPETVQSQEQEAPLPAPVPAADPWAISFPYDEYWLTQGPHGFSYGHMAIDLAAGKGTAIKSPIYGQITANYVDEYGNTTLIIENDVYVVTLLHGNYTAQIGQQVALGEVIGSEWNNGYTLDMDGRSCRNRDCGYHTHLNVYSKLNQANVNPLDILK